MLFFACFEACDRQRSRGLWLRALCSPPFWQFGRRQDTQSSVYNHVFLVMTKPNITACEKTNIPYHLLPTCVFAVRNRSAAHSSDGMLQPPQSLRYSPSATCGAYRQFNTSIRRQVCQVTNKRDEITKTHHLLTSSRPCEVKIRHTTPNLQKLSDRATIRGKNFRDRRAREE